MCLQELIELSTISNSNTGARRVTICSGARDTATNSRPTSAAPVLALAMKKLAKSSGTTRCSPSLCLVPCRVAVRRVNLCLHCSRLETETQGRYSGVGGACASALVMSTTSTHCNLLRSDAGLCAKKQSSSAFSPFSTRWSLGDRTTLRLHAQICF